MVRTLGFHPSNRGFDSPWSHKVITLSVDMDKYILDATKRLDNLKYKTTDDIRLLFTDIRLHIEHKKIQQKYPIIYFFANWLLHTEINKNITGTKLLLEINKILHSYDSKPIMENYPPALIEEIFSKGLLCELITIFPSSKPILNMVQNSKNWDKFYYLLLKYLTHRPIKFNIKDLVKIQNETIKGDYYICEFAVINQTKRSKIFAKGDILFKLTMEPKNLTVIGLFWHKK